MQIWAGLGNPGPQYAMHRHNVGFMAVDAIADRQDAPTPAKKHLGWVQEARIGGDKVILLKPATFMNESGRSIRAAMDFYKLSPADITVFYDELDIAPFKLKVKRGGGVKPGRRGVPASKSGRPEVTPPSLMKIWATPIAPGAPVTIAANRPPSAI